MSGHLKSPTRFQRRTCWMALTALAIVSIGAIAVGGIILISWVLGFLQPVLVPIVVAGIIAYLLEPLIVWMAREWPRKRAELVIYFGFLAATLLLIAAILVPGINQGIEIYNQRSELQAKVDGGWNQAVGYVARLIGEEKTAELSAWWEKSGPEVAKNFAAWTWGRVSGVFGLIGYGVGLFLIPIYLYFFLREGASIARNWSLYLPIRDSDFKTEFVATVEEINSSLIAFFRGQFVVSLIDGFLIGVVLFVMGLPYAFLIGIFVAILGLIPYLGNLLCLIPAMLIAWGHFEDPAHTWTFLPETWAYPLIVLGIFVVVQQINGLVTAPKIVGDSVGLHPLTVIFSVFFWALILGGILGALLAVPLTASLKVLLRRFVWQRRNQARDESGESGQLQISVESAG